MATSTTEKPAERAMERSTIHTMLYWPFRDVPLQYVVDETALMIRTLDDIDDPRVIAELGAFLTLPADELERVFNLGYHIELTHAATLVQLNDGKQVIYYATNRSMDGYALRDPEFPYVIQMLSIGGIEQRYGLPTLREMLRAADAKRIAAEAAM